MNKKGKIYIVIAVIAIALIMLAQYNKPKELNWFPSYVAQHKIPYGTYVFNDLMKALFQGNIEQMTIPPYMFLNKDNEASGTYVLVNGNINFEEAELDVLLNWTAKGNTLFIASENFEERLLDTLNLTTSSLYADFGEETSQLYQLVNPALKKEAPLIFEKDSRARFFNAIDTLNTTVIGLVDNYSEKQAIEEEHFNVIEQDFGEGKIILSTFPKAFTNYFILKNDNRRYTAGLLSYIDGTRPIYMDNHHKSGKTFYTSPMYIFLNTKELKWAYYITLIGALLYVVFEGKRKQRAIPVVVPLKNQTLAFTRTIADMYYEKGQQKPISEHKIVQFLEYIRSHFYMDSIKSDENFYKNLASRSSHDLEEIKRMFSYFEQLQKQVQVSDTELKKLNTLIEKFKHKADGK